MLKRMKKEGLGLLQVYTGPGKGKTTAAVGLAVRAASAGLTVAFIQFMKPDESSELQTLRNAGVTCSHFGGKGFLVPDGNPEPHIEAAKEGWERAVSYLCGETYTDVLIMDELCVALSLGLLDNAEVMTRIIERPHGLEVVCTGRDAPPELIAAADLVTDMGEVKHYFKQGIKARKGIEY